MSVLLFVVGAIAAVAGLGMVGYGIPINEFSFGNTLIVAGTTATVGGLIVIAIGAAVAQLHRITETLAIRPGQPLDMAAQPQPAARTTSSRIPFPPRPRSQTSVSEPSPPVVAPAPAEMPTEERAGAHVAPMLQNPDAAATAAEHYDIKEYEEVSLSPQQPMPAPAPAEFDEPAPPPPVSATMSQTAGRPDYPALDAPWRSAPPPSRPPQTSYFDTMWPAETRPARRPVTEETKPEPKPDFSPPEMEKPEPRVAILKSGVVDGMSYTLYVDGSIEAELPTGTLRFASINDLRSHLAKNN